MSALARLAERLGVFDRYHQADGTERSLEPETRLAVIRAMGHAVADEADAADALAAIEAEDAARRMPREGVVIADRPRVWRGPHDRAWRLTLEGGERIDGPPNGDLPPLPAGVHLLEAEGEETRLIAAPARAPSVADVTGRARLWGVTAALYGLVSGRSHGRGDYEDLARTAEALAGLGADFVGVNPVHDRGAAHGDLSPYSPSSRTAFDVGHLALDRVPELAACPAALAALAAEPEAQAAARAHPLGDSGLRARLAAPALDALFETFEARGGARTAAFEAWLAQGGAPRRRQAVYEALSLRHGADWRAWPAALHRPDAPEVAAFAAAEARAVRRAAWAQWLAEAQLAEAQARARAAGMALGLYLDIAVGVRPGGAETWALPDAFARGVSLGAPPDALSTQGQVWALAPFSPEGLRRADYAPFRAMLRAAMRRAGLVRIDHVLGVDRSFWVPENGAPGAYVRYPGDALMALIRLEAHRAACVVVGEDLGTVPEGFRARLDASGLHGCAVVQFEGGSQGFRRPADYAACSLASFGTHDTPTLAGWWQGRDVALRLDLGQLTPEGAEAAHAERAAARAALARLLSDEGLLPEGVDPDAPPGALSPALRDAVHALVAGAGSALAAFQLDDAFGETEPQNVPGTVTEQPNWRRRHRAPPEAMASDLDLARAAAAMSRARPRRSAPD